MGRSRLLSVYAALLLASAHHGWPMCADAGFDDLAGKRGGGRPEGARIVVDEGDPTDDISIHRDAAGHVQMFSAGYVIGRPAFQYTYESVEAQKDGSYRVGVPQNYLKKSPSLTPWAEDKIRGNVYIANAISSSGPGYGVVRFSRNLPDGFKKAYISLPDSHHEPIAVAFNRPFKPGEAEALQAIHKQAAEWRAYLRKQIEDQKRVDWNKLSTADRKEFPLAQKRAQTLLEQTRELMGVEIPPNAGDDLVFGGHKPARWAGLEPLQPSKFREGLYVRASKKGTYTIFKVKKAESGTSYIVQTFLDGKLETLPNVSREELGNLLTPGSK